MAKRRKYVIRLVWPEVCFDVIETRKLVDFSYHLQIHDWGWIPFFLKEENVWNNILELTKVDFFLDFFFF